MFGHLKLNNQIVHFSIVQYLYLKYKLSTCKIVNLNKSVLSYTLKLKILKLTKLIHFLYTTPSINQAHL